MEHIPTANRTGTRHIWQFKKQLAAASALHPRCAEHPGRHRGSHPWSVSVGQALALQTSWASRVIRTNQLPNPVATVAGIDVAYGSGWAVAAAAVLHYPELILKELALAELPALFPYIPGLLGFREGPAVVAALERLTRPPDLLMFDSQGIAHPRRLGLASHIGLLMNVPTIGCAKSCLCGQYTLPGNERGEHSQLMHHMETIGAVLRTRRNVKPLFVSIGHRLDLASAIQIVLNCCRGYRLPEPIRQAHQQAQLRLRSLDFKQALPPPGRFPSRKQ